MSWEYNEFEILTIVKQVYRTPYLNRLKQFFLHLLRNNLYIGRKNHSSNSLDPHMCIVCGKHPEKRIPILFSCGTVIVLTNQLVSVLREAGLLERGSNIEAFLFKGYNFNSIENLTLVTLWDFIYKARFNPEKHSTCKFTRYLQYKVDGFVMLAPNLKLGFWLVSNVLKRKINTQYDGSDI